MAHGRVLWAALLAVAAAGCRPGSGSCASSDFAPLSASRAPAFVARARAAGTSQLYVLDAEGAAIESGPAGMESVVWARTGSALGAGVLGADLGLARGSSWGGALLLLRGGGRAVAGVAVPSGDPTAFVVALEDPVDGTVATTAAGTTTFAIVSDGLIAQTTPPGFAPVPLGGGPVTAVAAIESAAGGTTELVVVLSAPVAGTVGTGLLTVLDPGPRAVVVEVALPADVARCRYMAVAPPGPSTAPTEVPVAVACQGMESEEISIPPAYLLYAVSRSAGAAPRLVGRLAAPDASAPILASPIVATPGGTVVHAGIAESGEAVLVSVDVALGTVRRLDVLGAPPEPGTELGAGAFHAGAGVLLWPSGAGARVLRWTVPERATELVPAAPVTLGACVTPIWEIVAIGAGAATPPRDAGVSLDAGAPEDAGAADAGAEPDAP